MTEFKEIKDVTSKEFEEALNIYTEAIPSSERQSIDTIKQRVCEDKEKLFVGLSDGEVALMALLYPLHESQFVLLDYMAVKPAYRKHALGSEFLKNMYKVTGFKNKLFLIEVENPKLGPDQETKQRRVYFYRKNGAKILKQVHYILPPLQGNTPTDMILLVMAQNRPVWLSGEAIKEAIRQIYRELYLRDKSDLLLQSFIDRIPERVDLG